MDPLFVALRLFEMRKYDDVNKITTSLLEKNPQDEAAWTLKMRALTQQVYVDEYEMEYDGAVDQMMDESAMAANPKPGTSLRQTAKPGPGARPMSRRTGRPVSGMLRPASRTVTGLAKVTTGRAVQSGQPLSAKIGRMLRQGTASMITSPNGPFITLSRLNLTKYTQKKYLSKALFEYIFYHDHETSMSLQMTNEALQVDDKDWWWHRARALCHYRLALYREAEKDIREAMKLQAHPEHFLYLAKIYAKIDLPAQAIETYKSGRITFPMEPAMLIGAARILEDMDDLTNSSLYYRDALKIDSMNFEALACVGMESYYNDQPELALRYYRRILQMGAHSAEIFINVGMCCFVSHQMDLMWQAFDNAFASASKDQLGDLYYNLGYICICSGEMEHAKRCFRLSVSCNPSNSEALAALAQLAYNEGDRQKAITLFSASITASGKEDAPPDIFYNLSVCYEDLGDYDNALKNAMLAYDNPTGLGQWDKDVKELVRRLQATVNAL